MLEAVGFDFDGVLTRKIDPDARKRSFNNAFDKLRDLGLFKGEFDFSEKNRGERYEAFFLRILNDDKYLVKKILEFSNDYYFSLGLENIKQPIVETLKIMRSLKSKNIPFFVASNNPGNHIYFDEFFGEEFPNVPIATMGIDNSVLAKPQPDLILQGFNSVGVGPNVGNSIFIGDKFNTDVIASIKAETLPILVFDNLNKVNRHISGIDELSVSPEISNTDIAQRIKIEFQNKVSEFLAINNFTALHEYILTRV